MKSIYIVRHVDYERLGWIPEILEELGLPYQSISLSEGDELPVLSDVRGVITMGGPMSAYQLEEHPWIADEMEFVKKLVKNEIPLLGICLGGQILAQAFGAKVTKGEPELGWIPLVFHEGGELDPLFKELDVPALFQLHWDQFELPKGAHGLLKSDACAHQAFRLGKNAYGLQFHPETNFPMVESVVQEYSGKVPQIDLDEAHRLAEEKSQQGRVFLLELLRRLFGEGNESHSV